MAIDDWFSASYGEARAKFLAAPGNRIKCVQAFIMVEPATPFALPERRVRRVIGRWIHPIIAQPSVAL